MYINEKYTSAYFCVIIDGKENFIFYEFDKLEFVKEISKMMKFGSEQTGGAILKGGITLQVHYRYI